MTDSEISFMQKTEPNILFATPVLYHSPIGGPTLRIENTIKALSQICHLTIYCRANIYQIGGKDSVKFYQSYCQHFHFAQTIFRHPYRTFFKRAINLFTRKTIGKNIFSPSYSGRENFAHILRIAQSIHADVIWLGYGNISYPLLQYIKAHSDYKVVVDTDSVWSQFMLRGIPYLHEQHERHDKERDGHMKEEEEQWGTRLADVTTAVSDVDAEYYRRFARHPAQIHRFSNAIDIDAYQTTPPIHKTLKTPCLYLAGTFDKQGPMEDAARWFISHIFPHVTAHYPDMHLYIVGSQSNTTLADIVSPHITITGRVPSVLPYLCYANVSVVPLRYESGTRFKILEAGACGIPVVSTSLGAEGLDVTHGKDILLADEPKAFAEAIMSLLNWPDYAKSLAKNLTQLIRQHYSLNTLVKEGRQILTYLILHSQNSKLQKFEEESLDGRA